MVVGQAPKKNVAVAMVELRKPLASRIKEGYWSIQIFLLESTLLIGFFGVGTRRAHVDHVSEQDLFLKAIVARVPLDQWRKSTVPKIATLTFLTRLGAS